MYWAMSWINRYLIFKIKLFKNYFCYGLCLLCIFAVTVNSLAENDIDNDSKINSDSIKNTGFNIAIFKENDFPAKGVPDLLTPDFLFKNLAERFSVIYLDIAQLSNEKYLDAHKVDLLILPYGETFPCQAFAQIKRYIFEGGGILNIAGRPFWEPVVKISGKWQKLDKGDSYKNFMSALGIKYYERRDDKSIGLSVTTSLGDTPIQPTHGNVFPYRVPVRDFYFLEELLNIKDNKQIVLIKSWRNPYSPLLKNLPRKWCLIGAKDADNPLNPKSPLSQRKLIQIIDNLAFPIIIYGLETSLPAYLREEKVTVSVKAANMRKNKETAEIEFKFIGEDGMTAYCTRANIELSPGEQTIVKEICDPGVLKDSFYKISAELKKNDVIFDKEENGFVFIDKNILKNGPTIKIIGDKFAINGKKSFILGMNYYESKLGELMWLAPNLLRIRDDFKAMHALNINFVRIHYHHSKWFRDYFNLVVKQELDPYFNIADQTVLPSERSLRILDAVIQLAQEEGLIFCMDIFSLVPEEMGDPVGWLGLKERIVEKEKIDVQKKFIALLAKRYKDVPGITWDLWNEPRLGVEDLGKLRLWAKQLRNILIENGDRHLITIGDDISLYLLDELDYASIHADNLGDFSKLKNLDKPFIFQEIWNSAGCSLREEVRQADKLKADFNDFLKSKAAGFVPWQWTRQARLWGNASDSEKWDDELGLCVHDDGSPKPAYYVLRGKINNY
ncbi:MAG: cellulase family glycosylhydrolase [Candidatus Omnitrophica bacterium]|nr:cellulase family glycosylhydrolase [Candidatus Omnitrophota bacterium]